jgi:hypothetical protein
MKKKKKLESITLDIVLHRINQEEAAALGIAPTMYDDLAAEQFITFCEAVVTLLETYVENFRKDDRDFDLTRLSAKSMEYSFSFFTKKRGAFIDVCAPEPAFPNYYQEYVRNLNRRKKYIQPETLKEGGIRHYDIIINDKIYHSYENALKEIEEFIKTVSLC